MKYSQVELNFTNYKIRLKISDSQEESDSSIYELEWTEYAFNFLRSLKFILPKNNEVKFMLRQAH